MNLATFIPWILTTGAITIGAWIGIVQWQRRVRQGELEAQARIRELADTRQAVAEFESRVEFTERLLKEGERKLEEQQ